MNERLWEFVSSAHENGYATGTPERSENGDKRLEYREDDWHYVDRYAGSRAFVGHELVRYDGVPVWGMSYRGAPTVEAIDHEPLYAFLRCALEASDRPYRGPARFSNDPYTYEAETTGTLEQFSGKERIELDGVEGYVGQYAGGRLE